MRAPAILILLAAAHAHAAPPVPTVPDRSDPRIDEAEKLRLEGATKFVDDAAARLVRFQRALAMEEQVYGKDDPRLLPALVSIRSEVSLLGDWVALLGYLERMRAMQERAHGRVSREVANTIAEMASTWSRLSEFTKSEPLFREANTIAEQALGAESVDFASFLTMQATGYSANQDYARAYALLARALAIVEKTVQEGPQLLGPLSQLAYVADLRGRFDESVALFRRLIVIADRAYPDNAMLRGSYRQQAAQPLLHAGHPDEAEAMRAEAQRMYQEELARIEAKVAAGGPGAAIAQAQWVGFASLLVGLYLEAGQAARALPLAKKKYDTAVALYGPDHPAVAVED